MTEELTNEITDKALIRKSYRVVAILGINIIIWGGIGVSFLFLSGLVTGILGIFRIELYFGDPLVILLIMIVAQISTVILAIFLIIREGTEIIRIKWKEK